MNNCKENIQDKNLLRSYYMGTNSIPVEQFYTVLQFQKETIIESVKTISFFNFMSLTIKQTEVTDHLKEI